MFSRCSSTLLPHEEEPARHERRVPLPCGCQPVLVLSTFYPSMLCSDVRSSETFASAVFVVEASHNKIYPRTLWPFLGQMQLDHAHSSPASLMRGTCTACHLTHRRSPRAARCHCDSTPVARPSPCCSCICFVHLLFVWVSGIAMDTDPPHHFLLSTQHPSVRWRHGLCPKDEGLAGTALFCRTHPL